MLDRRKQVLRPIENQPAGNPIRVSLNQDGLVPRATGKTLPSAASVVRGKRPIKEDESRVLADVARELEQLTHLNKRPRVTYELTEAEQARNDKNLTADRTHDRVNCQGVAVEGDILPYGGWRVVGKRGSFIYLYIRCYSY